MTESEFWKFLGYLQTNTHSGEAFVPVIEQMISLLDEGDYEDIFGTEGWRHRFGWDE